MTLIFHTPPFRTLMLSPSLFRQLQCLTKMADVGEASMAIVDVLGNKLKPWIILRKRKQFSHFFSLFWTVSQNLVGAPFCKVGKILTILPSLSGPSVLKMRGCWTFCAKTDFGDVVITLSLDWAKISQSRDRAAPFMSPNRETSPNLETVSRSGNIA